MLTILLKMYPSFRHLKTLITLNNIPSTKIFTSHTFIFSLVSAIDSLALPAMFKYTIKTKHNHIFSVKRGKQ